MSRNPKSNPTRAYAGAEPPAFSALVSQVGRPKPPSAVLPDWLAALALAIVTFFSYARVWSAGFVWDDNAHVTRPELTSLRGLWRIWLEPGATQQYYPVLHSVFWLEHRFLGDAPLGYHVANVLWHLLVVLLLYRVLRRLAVPGALLGAAVFAVHPVCVESVAWISEQKNTLSAAFYFAAALAYFRFDRERRACWYAAATALFILALGAKSVTATLPAALLVVLWWKRGHLSWRDDIRPLILWFALSVGAGTVTAWMEQTSVGATGSAYSLDFIQRVLVAGRAVWFYLGKILAPVDLIFIYPHWQVDARHAWQYLFPAALVAVLTGMFALRKYTRGPLAAALLFVGTLSPALGFINVFPFAYSYVADHFQYLAATAMIPALVAGFALVASRLPGPGQRAGHLAGAGVVVALAVLTWRQCGAYADADTLWRATIARNPGCWMARNNLGVDLLQSGRMDEGIAEIEQAIALNPRNAASYTNLGDALLQKDRPIDAVAHYQKAVDLEPDDAASRANLAAALLQSSQVNRAVAELHTALALQPGLPKAHLTLGNAYLQLGRPGEAEGQFRRALASGASVEAHANLGIALAELGRLDEAVTEFRAALVLNPNFAPAHINLGNVLLQQGRAAAAIAHFEKALALGPDSAATHNNLGLALLQAGRLDEAAAHFRHAIALNPAYVEAHRNLGAALFKQGRLDEARAEFQEAARLK